MAAVAAADRAEPPPVDLRLWWMCDRFGALPDVGAVYDQDAVTIRRMSVLDNIYNAVIRLRGMHGAQIHNLSVPERRIIRSLLDMELL